MDELSRIAVSNAILERTSFGFSALRAATIARTEIHNASSFANHAVVLSQFPQEQLMKRWTAVNDLRTRSHHADVNGTIIPMEEKFVVTTNGIPKLMDRPADPAGGAANVINCRCILVYEYDDGFSE